MQEKFNAAAVHIEQRQRNWTAKLGQLMYSNIHGPCIYCETLQVRGKNRNHSRVKIRLLFGAEDGEFVAVLRGQLMPPHNRIDVLSAVEKLKEKDFKATHYTDEERMQILRSGDVNRIADLVRSLFVSVRSSKTEINGEDKKLRDFCETMAVLSKIVAAAYIAKRPKSERSADRNPALLTEANKRLLALMDGQLATIKAEEILIFDTDTTRKINQKIQPVLLLTTTNGATSIQDDANLIIAQKPIIPWEYPKHPSAWRGNIRIPPQAAKWLAPSKGLAQ